MRELLFILLGGVITFFVLKAIAKKTPSTNNEKLKTLLLLPESFDVLKSEQFKKLSDTTEFREYVKEFSQEQIRLLAKSLTT